MTQHYTREAGYDGELYTGSGDAPGVNLSDLLDRGLPPLRAALEIGAAIADIISISEEDGTSHGDIRPNFIVITEDGSVSVEGYGKDRKRTRAPEPEPAGIATDIYGLGVVMHALLSNSPLGSLSKEAEAHDQSVVEKVQAVDLHSVAGKPWSGELRMYLATILAHDITERPEAIDIANVMGNASDDTPGEDLAGWAKRTVTAAGGGKTASKLRQGKAEDLSGPMSGIDESISPAIVVPSTNDAQSTAAWSKERVAALVAQQDEETVADLPEIEPETMEGPEIEHMEPPQVEAMEPPQVEEMEPPQVEEMEPPQVEAIKPPKQVIEQKKAPQTIVSAQSISASSFDLEPAETARIAKDKPKTKTVISGPASTTPTISGPSTSNNVPPPPPPPSKGTKKGGKGMLFVVIILIAAAVASQLLPSGDSDTSTSSGDESSQVNSNPEPDGSTEPPEQAVDQGAYDSGIVPDEPNNAEGSGEAIDEAPQQQDLQPVEQIEQAPVQREPIVEPRQEAPRAVSNPVERQPQRPAVTPPPRPTPTPTPEPEPEPEPVAVEAPAAMAPPPYNATISVVGGVANLRCGDGQTPEITGTQTMTFSSQQSCAVLIGDAMGALTVDHSGSWTCALSGAYVICSE